jgi:beta-glucanase (GH16 family)
MRKKILFIVLVHFLLIFVSPAKTRSFHWEICPKRYPARKLGIDFRNYSLTLHEDFKGKVLNTKRWYYLDENKVRTYGKMLRSNVAVSDGTLKLYARKSVDATGKTDFSAAMISTQNSFNQKYGYFEIRAKLLSQTGPQCSFWLLQHSVGASYAMPNPSILGSEIDIFEYHRGAGTEYIYYGLHWNGYNFLDGSHRTLLGNTYLPGISNGFHVFGLEWTPKEYILYIDGVERARTTTAVSHIPEFVILSTEITGFGGDRFRMINNVPDTFEVDYLKVYARKSEVTIFGDCDGYGWVSEGLQPGVYTAAELAAAGVVNNEASSIEVPDGWVITAFDGDNCKGDAVVIKSDKTCLKEFNDKLSSLHIKKNGKK